MLKGFFLSRRGRIILNRRLRVVDTALSSPLNAGWMCNSLNFVV